MSLPAGIISAGVGSRFQASGVATPKPLIEVAGRPLIGWVLAAYERAGIEGATILLHTRNVPARPYARKAFPKLKLRFKVKNTASTLESFCVVSSVLKGPSFLISTVDALYEPKELSRFLSRARRSRADIILGVTRHRVDRTSLRVQADKKGRVQSIIKGGPGPYATTGVYYCSAKIRREARKALKNGAPSLSSFLGLCPGLGLNVGLVEMPHVFDVDHPKDVRAAARRLRRA